MTDEEIKRLYGNYQDDITPEEEQEKRKEFEDKHSIQIYVIIAIILLFILFS